MKLKFGNLKKSDENPITIEDKNKEQIDLNLKDQRRKSNNENKPDSTSSRGSTTPRISTKQILERINEVNIKLTENTQLQGLKLLEYVEKIESDNFKFVQDMNKYVLEGNIEIKSKLQDLEKSLQDLQSKFISNVRNKKIETSDIEEIINNYSKIQANIIQTNIQGLLQTHLNEINDLLQSNIIINQDHQQIKSQTTSNDVFSFEKSVIQKALAGVRINIFDVRKALRFLRVQLEGTDIHFSLGNKHAGNENKINILLQGVLRQMQEQNLTHLYE